MPVLVVQSKAPLALEERAQLVRDLTAAVVADRQVPADKVQVFITDGADEDQALALVVATGRDDALADAIRQALVPFLPAVSVDVRPHAADYTGRSGELRKPAHTA